MEIKMPVAKDEAKKSEEVTEESWGTPTERTQKEDNYHSRRV